MVRAAVLFGPESLDVRDLNLVDPGAGEVSVRIAATGVCQSDHHIFERGAGEQPMVLGHEGAGIVEAVGSDVRELAVGDHVILTVVAECGRCKYCTNGQPTLCREGRVAPSTGTRFSLDGKPVGQMADISTWSERTVVSVGSAVKIDPSMPLAQAALIGCGVATGYGAAANVANVSEGDVVAVIGCGGVGLSGVQGARIRGASKIIAIDVFETKLNYATTLGATHVIKAGEGADVVAGVLAETGGDGADVCLDFVGSPASAGQAIALTRRGGQIVFTGLGAPEWTFPSRDVIMGGKIVKGNFMGMGEFKADFTTLVALYGSGDLLLDPMVSRTVGLDDIHEAFRAMEAGEVARTVIAMPES